MRALVQCSDKYRVSYIAILRSPHVVKCLSRYQSIKLKVYVQISCDGLCEMRKNVDIYLLMFVARILHQRSKSLWEIVANKLDIWEIAHPTQTQSNF